MSVNIKSTEEKLNILKNFRKKQKLTQPQASEICQVSLSTLQKWETGANPISLPTLLGVLVLLGADEKKLKSTM